MQRRTGRGAQSPRDGRAWHTRRGRRIRSRDSDDPAAAISASRIVLATIEAAAIDCDRASPPTIAAAGQMSPSGTSRPSISAKSGRGLSAASARAIARRVAPRML